MAESWIQGISGVREGWGHIVPNSSLTEQITSDNSGFIQILNRIEDKIVPLHIKPSQFYMNVK